MGDRKLCLIAWTVATVVLTGGVCLGQVLTMRVTNSTQYLLYPSSTNVYDNNAARGWLLQADSVGDVVHVNFTFVDIEYDDNCSHDYVQLFNGPSTYDVSLGKVCGSTAGDFYSSGQSMYITFHSDSSIAKRGFILSYQAVSRWNAPTTTDSVSPAVIAGAVVGSVVFLIAVVVGIVLFIRHQSERSTRNRPSNTKSKSTCDSNTSL